MSKLKIAAQLYTIREFDKTPEDIAASMKKIRQIGYDAVQVSGMGPIEPERLKEIMDKEGLTICATHIGFDRLKNELDMVIKEHKLWNCKYVGLGSMPDRYRKSAEACREFIREISPIAKEIKASGLQFIYHNHNFEFAKYDGKTLMDILFEETDPDTFGFEIDTYWVQCGGADPIQWINKVEGRMQVVHFKDMVVNSEAKSIMAEVGEGNLNWKGIIEACEKTGVEWCPVEQDFCQRDPFESLAISFNNLKKMGL